MQKSRIVQGASGANLWTQPTKKVFPGDGLLGAGDVNARQALRKPEEGQDHIVHAFRI